MFKTLQIRASLSRLCVCVCHSLSLLLPRCSTGLYNKAFPVDKQSRRDEWRKEKKPRQSFGGAFRCRRLLFFLLFSWVGANQSGALLLNSGTLQPCEAELKSRSRRLDGEDAGNNPAALQPRTPVPNTRSQNLCFQTPNLSSQIRRRGAPSTPAALTSSLGDLQVAGGQVLLHVLLEGFLEELLPLLQLDLGGGDTSLFGPRDPLRVLRVQLH